MKIMIIIYGALLGLLLLLMVLTAKGRSEFRHLNSRQHPLKLFYPLAAVLLRRLGKRSGSKSASRIRDMIRSLHVKEQVEREVFLYRVKKWSAGIGVFSAFCILGLMVSVVHCGSSLIKSLPRNAYGGGTASYSLEVEYGDQEETIEVEVSPRQYTKEEILEIFSDSYEGVLEELKGENESLENVCKPLNLISQFGDIDISWEIEDSDILDYNGEIREELGEDEEKTVTLSATFSIGDVTETYRIPVLLKAADLSEQELLLSNIRECMEEQEDVYQDEAELPDQINGIPVVFRKIQEHNEYLFLLLGFLAIAAIAIGYDKSMEKKVKERRVQMMTDFTEIVSKLSLLYDAGLSIFKSWERVVEDREKRKETDRYAYLEMKVTLEKIRSGQSEGEAYAEFGKRCGIHSYIKLGNILEQNISRGTKGMKLLLKQEVEDAFEQRTRLARKKGEEAGTKLLIPMMLMLGIVLAIIAIPALMSLNL